MFVGVGASRVRDLFEQAKQNAPCIIFVDEIDAVGRHRGAGLGGGHDEREQTLNQLLVEMDGFEMKDNVILIAATNRPDILDPALLRPGRFDRQVVVDRPDRSGRKAILEVHTRGKPISKEIDLDALAAQTPGFTGADLANLVNEAALLAARYGKKIIEMNELEEGIMRVLAGPEKKSRLISEKEKAITAYHEMGHALVGHFLEYTDPVHKISVVSRGAALGFTISLPTEDKFLTTKGELMDTLSMTLGGRAAEEVVFGEITTGAANDLEKATGTAKQMIMRYGMSEELGPRTLGHDQSMPFLGREFQQQADYSEEVARQIDDEIRRIIEEAHQRASDLLAEKRELLDRISKILIQRETIEAVEFQALVDGVADEEVFRERDEKEARRRERPSASARSASGRRRPCPSPRTSIRPIPSRPPEAPVARVDRDKIEQGVRLLLEGIGEDPARAGTGRDAAPRRRHVRGHLLRDRRRPTRPSCSSPCRAITIRRWCSSATSTSTRCASTTCCPFTASRTSPTSPAGTGASPVSPSWRAWSAPSPRARSCRSASPRRSPTRSCAPSKPAGAAVLIEAEHLCMSMRGVRTPGARTITSAVRGIIETNEATRAEVFSLINAPR